jgi:hypothetical protein
VKLRQARASPTTSSKGTTSQLAEKSHGGGALYQGTSLLVPQGQQNEWGFSACAILPSRRRYFQQAVQSCRNRAVTLAVLTL